MPAKRFTKPECWAKAVNRNMQNMLWIQRFVSGGASDAIKPAFLREWRGAAEALPPTFPMRNSGASDSECP